MKIRFGVVGCGYIAGKSFIPALMKSSKAKLISVASRDINKANFFKKKYSCDVDKDYESLMTRDDIDAVFVCTPTDTHFSVVSKVLNKSKSVLVEKPLTTINEQDLSLFELARSKSQTFYVAFNNNYRDQLLKSEPSELFTLHPMLITK